MKVLEGNDVFFARLGRSHVRFLICEIVFRISFPNGLPAIFLGFPLGGGCSSACAKVWCDFVFMKSYIRYRVEDCFGEVSYFRNRTSDILLWATLPQAVRCQGSLVGMRRSLM